MTSAGSSAFPTLFQPLTIRGRRFKNRLTISPMCQHACKDGFATDWHMVHYGKFVLGGASLVMTESTAISSDSRIGVADLGLWKDDHIAGMRRLADFAHNNGSLMGVQLAHMGCKAFSDPLWHGGRAMEPQRIHELGLTWRRVGPSAIAPSSEWSTPTPLSLSEIVNIRRQFVDAARRANEAELDVVELHFGHGYLVASFLSPITNKRTDEYGGSRENRMRLAIEIARDVREVWPEEKPLFVRLSCVDGAEGGWRLDDSVVLAAQLKAAGVDVIDCSSGGLSEEIRRSNVPRGIGFQVPFAETIRRESGVTTQAVGLIISAEQAESIIAKGHADLVAIGREALRNPYWPNDAWQNLTDAETFDTWPVRHAAWLDMREPVLRKLIAEEARG
jgi:2,4-dienoyl-CoA reductase-like NADH-dependent reductase (Old Yellow Enzyme family)